MIRICSNHLGFHPDADKKIVLLLDQEKPQAFTVKDLGSLFQAFEGRVEQYKQDDAFGASAIVDLTELREPGLYQIIVDGVKSVPFFIRQDLWTRTAYDAFYFSHIQRCGQAVEGWHDACHLDDGIVRETGEYVDTTGGWHDAGDLRKWMRCTMMPAIAMCWLKRHSEVKWSRYAKDDIYDELKWGNGYFHKMIDKQTGQVWHDAGGGLNSDNSDNRWTDNIPESGDERYTHITNGTNELETQFMFIYLQWLSVETYKDEDAAYSDACAQIAELAEGYGWSKFNPQVETTELAFALLATVESQRQRPDERKQQRIAQLVAELSRRQLGKDSQWPGAFTATGDLAGDLFKHSWESGLPVVSLLEAYALDAGRYDCSGVIRSYLNDYIIRISETNAFRMIPYGVWATAPGPETFRPLAGGGVYRMFMPIMEQGQEECIPVPWWVGTNSHLLSHSLALSIAYRLFGDPQYRELAYAQLHWIVGANPLQASMMSGYGLNQPVGYARFTGEINGAIMNGIGGDQDDRPMLNMDNEWVWETNEYWSPHQGFYLMTLSILAFPDLSPTIGLGSYTPEKSLAKKEEMKHSPIA